MLDGLSRHRVTLLKRVRYGGDALRTLLDGLGDDDREKMLSFAQPGQATKRRGGVNVEWKNFDTFPQLAMLCYDDDGQILHGIYLFLSEVVKLVQHMNTVFAFSSSDALKFDQGVEKRAIAKCPTDDFF